MDIYTQLTWIINVIDLDITITGRANGIGIHWQPINSSLCNTTHTLLCTIWRSEISPYPEYSLMRDHYRYTLHPHQPQDRHWHGVDILLIYVPIHRLTCIHTNVVHVNRNNAHLHHQMLCVHLGNMARSYISSAQKLVVLGPENLYARLQQQKIRLITSQHHSNNFLILSTSELRARTNIKLSDQIVCNHLKLEDIKSCPVVGIRMTSAYSDVYFESR